MADQVIVEFGAKIDELVSGVDEIKKKIETINTSSESLAAGFGRLKDVITEAFSVAAIIAFIDKMAELGLQTERTMATLGMSAEEVGTLRGLAAVTGTSFEGLAISLERFALNVQRSTRDAVNPQAEALRVLGLRAKDLIGIPTSDYIDKLREAVSKFNPGLNLTTALMQVGSRGFQQIIPLLMMDTEEYNKLKDAIRQANDGLAASVPGMANTHMQLSLLNLTIQSAGAAIFDKLKPAIDSVVKSFQYFASYIRDASKEGGALSGTFELVAGTARLVAAAIVSITSGILAFGVAVEGVAKLAAGQIDQFEKSAADTAKALETIGTELKARLAEIWSAPIPVTVRPPGVDARAMNEGLAKAMSERLKIIQDEYKLETDIINKRYGDFFFVENAKTNALLAALDKRYNEEVKAGETTTLAYAKWALDRQKILDAANKSYESALNNVFSGVQSAFNSQLRGMLAGTTSFATAFKSILGDMIIWAIQEFEKMAFKWIAHEVIQTTATEAGVAARTGAEATGAAASAGLGVASAIRAIMNSAAETFAGVFANLSLILGPAAAGPAAASSATVASMAGLVAAADVGTNYVARTGLAVIHMGEAVVPAQFNTPFSGAGIGNTPPVTVNVTNNGAMSNYQIQQQARVIAKAVADVWRFNPSTRPAY